jgi:hypothetical protein
MVAIYSPEVAVDPMRNVPEANPGFPVSDPVLANQEQQSGMYLGLAGRELQDHQSAAWAGTAMTNMTLQAQQSFRTAQQTATGDGSDFSSNFNKQLQSQMQTYLDAAPTQQAKDFVQAHIQQLQTTYGDRAIDYASNMNNSYYTNQAQQTVDKGAQVLAQDHTQYGNVLTTTSNAINNMPLPQEQKFKLNDYMQSQFTTGAMDGLLQTPGGVQTILGMTGPALGGTNYAAGSPQESMVNAAVKGGVDPKQVLAMAQVESSTNPNQGKSTTSNATGMGQMMPGTFAQYGPKGGDINNPNDQAVGIANYVKDINDKYTTSLGQAPTDGQVRLGYHWGITGGMNIIKAAQNDPSTPLSSIVSPATIAANKLPANTTVGDAAAQADLEMNKANDKLGQGVNNSTLISHMTPAQIQAYHKKAVDVQEQNNAQTAVVYQQQAQSDVEQASATGQPPKQPLTPAIFSTMYKNPYEAQQKFQEYQDNVATGISKNQMATEDDATIQSKISQQAQRVSDAQNTPMYGEQQRVLNNLQTAYMQKQQEQKSDPAGYMLKYNPVLNKNYNDWQTATDPAQRQAAMTNYFTGQIAAQKQQGIMNPQLLSKPDENAKVQALVNTQGQQTVDAINQIKQEYGSYTPQIIAQLSANKNMSGMTSILTAPPGIAQATAANLRTVPVQTLEQGLPSGVKGTDVTKAVQQNMANYIKSVDPLQLGKQNYTDLYNTIQKTAMQNAATSGDAQTAANYATNMFLGKYNFVPQGQGQTLRVPQGIDANAVATGGKSIINSLSLNDIDTTSAKVYQSPWYVPNSGHDDSYLKYIQSNGYWKTDPTDKTASLWFKGQDNRPYPVIDKQGNQITNSLQSMATAKAIYHGSGITPSDPNIPGITSIPNVKDSQDTGIIAHTGVEAADPITGFYNKQKSNKAIDDEEQQ